MAVEYEFVNIVPEGVPFVCRYELTTPYDIRFYNRVTWNVASATVPDATFTLRLEDANGNKIQLGGPQIMPTGAPSPLVFSFFDKIQLSGTEFPQIVTVVEWEMDLGSASGGEIFITEEELIPSS